ncbi:MAG: helix-turn-helix domain-containing protein, partial [bacterium]
EEGKFRDDLYYRLNVIPLHIPPLRQRVDDLPLLVAHFIERFNKANNRKITRLNEAAMAALRKYSWPGNVRELENLIERLTILHGEGEIGVENLPDRIRALGTGPSVSLDHFPEEGVNLNKLLEEYEDNLIVQAMKKAKGVKNQAAKLLNINRTTLVEKLKKKNLDV